MLIDIIEKHYDNFKQESRSEPSKKQNFNKDNIYICVKIGEEFNYCIIYKFTENLEEEKFYLDMQLKYSLLRKLNISSYQNFRSFERN